MEGPKMKRGIGILVACLVLGAVAALGFATLFVNHAPDGVAAHPNNLFISSGCAGSSATRVVASLLNTIVVCSAEIQADNEEEEEEEGEKGEDKADEGPAPGWDRIWDAPKLG